MMFKSSLKLSNKPNIQIQDTQHIPKNRTTKETIFRLINIQLIKTNDKTNLAGKKK